MKLLFGLLTIVVFMAIQCRAQDPEQFLENMKKKLMSLFKYEAFDGNWPPKYCRDHSCPYFKILNKTDEYELREYNASNWVTTTCYGTSFMTDSRNMFLKLFNYINGKNSQKKKIPMTVPVLMELHENLDSSASSSNITMGFYLSMDNPPIPNESNVQLKRNSVPLKYYVKSFRGFAFRKSDWKKEAIELRKAVGPNSQYKKTSWFTASYNSPFELFKRHNEVWLLAQ